MEFSRIFPTPQEVFHTGGVNSSGQSVRVFSVNMARSVFLEIKRLFLIFDFPILIFRTSLIQALTEPIIQTHNFEFATAQRTDSTPGVETKPNQRRTQNQPTRYYDQALAMNWDHAASWGRGGVGLALAILVGLGRVEF